MTTRANPPEHDPVDPIDITETTPSVPVVIPGPAAEAGPAAIAPDAAAFSGRPNNPSRLRVGLVGGAAVALAVGVVATSLAASPAPSGADANLPAAITPGLGLGLEDDVEVFDHGRFDGPGRGDITITAISGSDVTLGTDDGWRRTIAVTDAVDLTRAGQDVALSSLKVGDLVRFRQTRNDDGTYTVTALAVVVPTIRGEVDGVTLSGFKVTTRDGAVWTVTVNGSTSYAFGAGDGTLADVINGETVVVAGDPAGDNALTALSVRVNPDQAAGTVTAKTADTITITKRDGSKLTVHVDADTTYRVRGAAATTDSLADVTVDMAIGVSGRLRADGSIDADVVLAGTGRGMLRDGDGLGGFGGFGGRGGFPGRGGFHGPDGTDDSATPDASPTTAS